MNAIAFDTIIENGSVLIPEEYKKTIPSVAAITIIYRIDENKKNTSWNVMLDKMKNARKIDNFKVYSKEEMNEG